MKYPMEYWTGRMSGFIVGITKHQDIDEDTKLYGLKIIEEFEADYKGEN